MASTTKDRILDTSAELFRRQGYMGTGLKQLVAEAGAPFGSIYHFFPGGKEQLGAETIRRSGELYLQLFVEIAAAAPDVPTAISDFFAGAAETLRETDYADACPIATVALEVASTSEPLRVATADVFESWLAAATQYLVAAGMPAKRAREIAFSMLSLLEGAFVFSRAMRSTEPVEIAGAAATAMVREALPGS
ncbi:MAG: TetR/AcrR family transcriptional regulator [Thermoleophilaceae bacterium]|jgi:AcrR family transcriptional regulator